MKESGDGTRFVCFRYDIDHDKVPILWFSFAIVLQVLCICCGLKQERELEPVHEDFPFKYQCPVSISN